MEELISVIVPIYKVEAYLERCIRSIVNQTYKNLEIILVDDGSPDSCPDICDVWKEKDDRIKVIHKKNGGLSDARNAGMQIMTGTYISYIDSDDWVANDMYEKMMYAIKKNDADICECQFEKTAGIVKSNKEQKTDKVTILKKEEALKAVVEEKINPVVWNKIYKREIVDQLYFEKGKYNEDEFWTYQVVEKAEKIVQIEDVGYYYFFREDSIINETYSISKIRRIRSKISENEILRKISRDLWNCKTPSSFLIACIIIKKDYVFLSDSDLKTLKLKVKAIYKDIPIDKNDIKEYTKKGKNLVLLYLR